MINLKKINKLHLQFIYSKKRMQIFKVFYKEINQIIQSYIFSIEI